MTHKEEYKLHKAEIFLFCSPKFEFIPTMTRTWEILNGNLINKNRKKKKQKCMWRDKEVAH